MVDYAKLASNAKSAEEANNASIQRRKDERGSFFRQLGVELQREVHAANNALRTARLPLFSEPAFGDGFVLLIRENGQACRVTNDRWVEGIDVYITADYPSKQADQVEDRTLHFCFDSKKSCLSVKRIRRQYWDYEDLPNVGPRQLAQSIVAMVVGARLVNQFGFRTDEWDWKIV